MARTVPSAIRYRLVATSYGRMPQSISWLLAWMTSPIEGSAASDTPNTLFARIQAAMMTRKGTTNSSGSIRCSARGDLVTDPRGRGWGPVEVPSAPVILAFTELPRGRDGAPGPL